MKKILIIVDMQNDFIEGSLSTSESKEILPNVVKKADNYFKNGGTIIFTRDTHDYNYLKTQEGKFLPVKHCIKNTDGWQIHDDLKKFQDIALVFEKNTFGSKELAMELVNLDKYGDIEEIEICGVCTDICVISNALLIKAFLPGIKTTVDSRCCAGVNPTSHRTALEAMKMCQINVL